MIIDKGLYGLKTSSARFHESLSSKLRGMGFTPSKADFDLWIRPMEGHYEYVAAYVDDILAFSKDPMSIIEEIKKEYMLKGVGSLNTTLAEISIRQRILTPCVKLTMMIKTTIYLPSGSKRVSRLHSLLELM